jgi:hypothetical protein
VNAQAFTREPIRQLRTRRHAGRIDDLRVGGGIVRGHAGQVQNQGDPGSGTLRLAHDGRFDPLRLIEQFGMPVEPGDPMRLGVR